MKRSAIAALGVGAAICCVGHMIVLAFLGGAGLSARAGWAAGAGLILLGAAALLIVVLRARSAFRSRSKSQARQGH